MLSGDIGRTAELARADALHTARLSLFHPLKSMLASPVVDEAEALTRLTAPVWVEDKYDGIRAQLHKAGDKVRLYSRDLNDIPRGFPRRFDAADEAELERIFAASQERGNEGLMLKDPDSIYAPRRRGLAWLKLKKALTTFDCVVVGVETGHGRRHGVLSDYTFAVLDDRPEAPPGKLVNIGKAYSGLTDPEIAEMTRWFEAHTVSRHGRFRVVEPSVVVEIAFDVVHASKRHASGFALRFPRIVRIRDDKDPREVDGLSTVAALHDRLQVAGRYGVLTGEERPDAP